MRKHSQANDHTHRSPAGPVVPASSTPFLELRIGGLHVTIQRLPYGLIALATTIGGIISGATWFGQ
jgi:hypothetical protein